MLENLKCEIRNHHTCLPITSPLRLLGRFAAEHNHTPTALRLVCGLYTSNIDYKA